MKLETRNALTPMDLCTLIARETVFLLNTSVKDRPSALRLRMGLGIFAAACEREKETVPLQMWIDQELENTHRDASSGQSIPHLINPNWLSFMPDAATLLDAVWMLFQAAVQSPWDDRQTLLETAKTLTEIGELENILLNIDAPDYGFLKVTDLRDELDSVRIAFRHQEAAGQNAGQPAQV